MNVSSVMSRRVAKARAHTTFRELWRLIIRKQVNAVPVVDRANKLVGLVTKDDLLRSLYPDYREYLNEFSQSSDYEALERKIKDRMGLTAKDVMCTRVIFTFEDTPIMRALSRMIVRRVNQLPVLSNGSIVVGMVTKGDIFTALFQKHLQKNSRRPKKHGIRRRGA